jgi:hypothetical protein
MFILIWRTLPEILRLATLEKELYRQDETRLLVMRLPGITLVAGHKRPSSSAWLKRQSRNPEGG